MKKYNVTVNGTVYEVEVEEVEETAEKPAEAPKAAAPKAAAPKPAAKAAAAGGTPVKAPMPGSLMKINVKEGDAVKKGAVLCILEAMKMENEICAPEDATVASIAAKQGDQLATGDVILTLK